MTYEERLKMIDPLDRDSRRKLTKARDIRVGWWMALFLGGGTVIEYAIAITVDWNLPVMVTMNIAEAAAIMVYFMHLPRAWRGGHGNHED